MDHPIYHLHPTSFIRAPPKQQKHEALSAYFYRYTDYLRLRAYLKNIDTNLDAPSELDDFIDGTSHSTQYRRLIREDRKSQSPNILVQFSQNRIVGTLNRLRVDYIDSFTPPTRRPLGNNGVQGGKNLLPRFQRNNRPSQNTSSRQQSHRTASSKPKTAAINSIELDPEQPLLHLEDPDWITDIGPLHEYQDNYKQAVINNINKDPREFDTSKPCLVCNKPGHTFDDCPILNNIAHLKKHYISWKMFLARTNRQQEEITHNNTVNLLETEYYNIEQEPDYGEEEEINFMEETVAEYNESNDTDFP